MDELALRGVVERLEKVEHQNHRLERQNRWLRLGMLAVLAVVGGLLLLGMGKPKKVIEAQKFVVRDADGRVRATLGPADEAWQRQFADVAPTDAEEQAKWRAELPDVTWLALYDRKGKPRVELATTAEGSLVVLLDRAGESQMVMHGHELGAMASLMYPAGGPAVTLAASQREANLMLWDKQGRQRGIFRLAQSASAKEPVLELRDDKDNAIFHAPGPQPESQVILAKAPTGRGVLVFTCFTRRQEIAPPRRRMRRQFR